MNVIGSEKSRFRVGIAAAALLAGVTFVVTSLSAEASPVGVAVDGPPFAVEDFDYPGADRVLAERGIELKRGDGHIVLADCAGENLLRVSARGQSNQAVCFRVTGDEGWLTLRLEQAYLVRANDYGNTHLELTADSGDTQSFDLGPNDLESVGEAHPDSGGQVFALLEIRVTR